MAAVVQVLRLLLIGGSLAECGRQVIGARRRRGAAGWRSVASGLFIALVTHVMPARLRRVIRLARLLRLLRRPRPLRIVLLLFLLRRVRLIRLVRAINLMSLIRLIRLIRRIRRLHPIRRIRRPFALALSAAVALLPSCQTAPPDRLDALFANELTVVDLTHALSADMPYWPNSTGNPFVHDTLRAQPSGAPAMAAYSTPEHHGTHLDAPIHGGDNLPSVDELDAADLFGRLVVIDVTARAADDPDYAVRLDDLTAWEAEHGVIPTGAIVLMASGWSEKWTEGQAYYAPDGDGRLHFPGFSPEAARFLVTERRVKAIGTDTGSVDPGNADGFPVHGIANGSGVYHLENVARVHELPPVGAYLIVAPIKIEGGSGGQVRLFAVVP